MVRITRDRINTQRGKLQPVVKALVRCCLAVLMSAAMPLLFVLRISVSMKQMSHLSKTQQLSEQQQQQQYQGISYQPPQKLNSLPFPYTFLAEILAPTSPTDAAPKYLGSEIVELDHCSLQQISDWTNFMVWSRPMVNDTLERFHANTKIKRALKSQDFALMEQEFILELLEMYATSNGFCDFEDYRPSVPPSAQHDRVGGVLKTWNESLTAEQNGNRLPRFLVVIIAFRDAEQLERLIEAMRMPQHRFIIHLERQTPPAYVKQVQAICQKYANYVFMLQFGTVVYRTDSVSMINLRIMRWVVEDLKLSYDYHVQIDGAAYPLWNAHELALYVQQQSATSVWLGELTHRGKVFRDARQLRFLQRKRLVTTVVTKRRGPSIKLQKNLSPSQVGQPPRTLSNATTEWLDVSQPSSFIHKTFRYKTTSGNQAIYSHAVVKKLLQSSQVMELFAVAKYGCCCCIEERSWAAAMALIGEDSLEDALTHTSMFQVWGGLTEETCGSSMNNAVLTANASLCYRLEDVHLQNSEESETMTTNNETVGARKPSIPVDMWGNETMDFLKRAKERGVWFARKFNSSDEQSMALLTEIQDKLHHPLSKDEQMKF